MGRVRDGPSHPLNFAKVRYTCRGVKLTGTLEPRVSGQGPNRRVSRRCAVNLPQTVHRQSSAPRGRVETGHVLFRRWAAAAVAVLLLASCGHVVNLPINQPISDPNA